MTVAADPEALRLVLIATGDLGDRVGRAANDVSDALAPCRPPVSTIARRSAPSITSSRTLVARWRAAGDATARFADELAAADAGSVIADLLRQPARPAAPSPSGSAPTPTWPAAWATCSTATPPPTTSMR